MNEDVCGSIDVHAYHTLDSSNERCICMNIDSYLETYGAMGGHRSRKCITLMDRCESLQKECEIISDWKTKVWIKKK